MTRLFPRREPIAHSQKLIFDFRTILLLCALSVAGCAAQPRLGADYAADEHAAVESDGGKLIIYREASDAWRDNFYDISIDGTRIGKLSDGGFLSITVVPENHSVAVAYAGGFGRATRPTNLDVDIKVGAASFLRLSHRFIDGVARRCGESEETISICRGAQRAYTVLEDAPVEQAQAELATLRETI